MARDALPGERPLAVADTWRLLRGSTTVSRDSVVVVTDTRLLIGKAGGFFRGAGTVARFELADVDGVAYGPLLGVGPTWEISFRERGQPYQMYFEPSECETVARILQRAVAAARGDGAPDPGDGRQTPAQIPTAERVRTVADLDVILGRRADLVIIDLFESDLGRKAFDTGAERPFVAAALERGYRLDRKEAFGRAPHLDWDGPGSRGLQLRFHLERPAPQNEAAGNRLPPGVLERLERRWGFINATRNLATRDMVGQPFGETFGLEQTLALLNQHVPTVSEVRESDGSFCHVLLLGASEDRYSLDDLAKVMGADERAARTYRVPPDRFRPVSNLAVAATTFIEDFAERSGRMWDLWNRQDNVAAEFLCWHVVAVHRLGTLGWIPTQPQSVPL